jgi:hypothetical protein
VGYEVSKPLRETLWGMGVKMVFMIPEVLIAPRDAAWTSDVIVGHVTWTTSRGHLGLGTKQDQRMPWIPCKPFKHPSPSFNSLYFTDQHQQSSRIDQSQQSSQINHLRSLSARPTGLTSISTLTSTSSGSGFCEKSCRKWPRSDGTTLLVRASIVLVIFGNL